MDARQVKIYFSAAIFGGAAIGLLAHAAERFYDSNEAAEEEDDAKRVVPARRSVNQHPPHRLNAPFGISAPLVPESEDDMVRWRWRSRALRKPPPRGRALRVLKTSTEWLEHFEREGEEAPRELAPRGLGLLLEEARSEEDAAERALPLRGNPNGTEVDDFAFFDDAEGTWESLQDTADTPNKLPPLDKAPAHLGATFMPRPRFAAAETAGECKLFSLPRPPSPESALQQDLLRLMLPEFTTVNGDSLKELGPSRGKSLERSPSMILPEGFFDPPSSPPDEKEPQQLVVAVTCGQAGGCLQTTHYSSLGSLSDPGKAGAQARNASQQDQTREVCGALGEALGCHFAGRKERDSFALALSDEIASGDPNSGELVAGLRRAYPSCEIRVVAEAELVDRAHVLVLLDGGCKEGAGACHVAQSARRDGKPIVCMPCTGIAAAAEHHES